MSKENPIRMLYYDVGRLAIVHYCMNESGIGSWREEGEAMWRGTSFTVNKVRAKKVVEFVIVSGLWEG